MADRVATWQQFNAKSSLESFWNADKNLIFLSGVRRATESDGSLIDSNYFWPNVISNPWSNTRHSEQVKDDLLNGIKTRPMHVFYVSQSVLTPDANVVTTGWMRGINSLKDMARKWMNPEIEPLMTRLDQQAQVHGTALNIIIADFYEHSLMVDKAIQLNLVN